MSCCKYLLKMSFRLILLVKDQVLFTAQFLSVYTVDYMYNSEGKNKAESHKFYCFKKILYNLYFSGWFVLENKNASGPYSGTMYTVWATKLTKHRACSNRELYINIYHSWTCFQQQLKMQQDCSQVKLLKGDLYREQACQIY